MFQDGSDRVPTRSPPTLRTSPAIAEREKAAGGRTALRAVPPSRGRPPPPGVAEARRVTLGPLRRPTSGVYNTAPGEGGGYLPPGLLTAGEPVVALPPRKVRPSTRPKPRAPVRPHGRSGGTAEDTPARLNSAGGLCGPIRLPLNGFTYS